MMDLELECDGKRIGTIVGIRDITVMDRRWLDESLHRERILVELRLINVLYLPELRSEQPFLVQGPPGRKAFRASVRGTLWRATGDSQLDLWLDGASPNDDCADLLGLFYRTERGMTLITSRQ